MSVFIVKVESRIKPNERKEYIGERAMFECESPPDNIRWFFEKKLMIPGNVFTSINGRILSIRQLHIYNAGDYYCYTKRFSPSREPFLSQAKLIPIGKFVL